jgi:hypothetical protein
LIRCNLVGEGRSHSSTCRPRARNGRRWGIDRYRQRFGSSATGICCGDVATEWSSGSRCARECPCRRTEVYARDRHGCAEARRTIGRLNLIGEGVSHFSSRRARTCNDGSRRIDRERHVLRSSAIGIRCGKVNSKWGANSCSRCASD